MLMHMYEIQKNGTDEPICEAGIETQIQKMGMCMGLGKGGKGWDELGEWH